MDLQNLAIKLVERADAYEIEHWKIQSNGE